MFTHALHGEEDLLRIMRGFVLGLVAYALFCFALAESLGSLSIAASFAFAVMTALAAQSIALARAARRVGERQAESRCSSAISCS